MKKIATLTELLGAAIAWFLISMAGMLVIDGLFALMDLGEFGDLSGWLGLVGPVILFAGQFRESKGEPGRFLVALFSVVCALGLGMMAAGIYYLKLPPIATGAIGAVVATVIYATFWHVGLIVAAKARS